MYHDVAPPAPPKKGAMKATALEHCFLNRFCKYQFLRSSDKFRKQTRTLTDLLYLIHISISKNPALKNLLFLLNLHFPIYIWPKTHHYFFTPYLSTHSELAFCGTHLDKNIPLDEKEGTMSISYRKQTFSLLRKNSFDFLNLSLPLLPTPYNLHIRKHFKYILLNFYSQIFFSIKVQNTYKIKTCSQDQSNKEEPPGQKLWHSI